MTLEERQLEMLAAMSALDPPPRVMGGYAEDALMYGTVTRPHADIDLLCMRSELPVLLRQLATMGFEEFETWGEARPGEAFYLFGQVGELKLEIGVLDEADGDLWIYVHSLSFTVGDEEAPAGYRVQMPRDSLQHPAVEIDGITVWPASPLAVYQLRAGIASQGSFGPLSERHQEAARRLRETFFPEHSEAALEPRTERLTSA